MPNARRAVSQIRSLIPALTTIAVTLALVVAVFIVATVVNGNPAHADPAGTVNEVAIDMDSTGNTPTSLGTREVCISKNIGDTFDIDVTVKGIDPDDGIAGFQFTLKYDSTKLRVTGVDKMQLIASGGGTLPVDYSNPVPDTDGAFQVAFADFGPNIESGDGVLSRITLESIGNGVSTLTLGTGGANATIIGSADATLLDIASLHNAYEAQGEPCPATAPPTPTPPPTTPTPTSKPPAPPPVPLDEVAIDMDPSSDIPNPANGALGTRQACISRSVGDTFAIDVTVKGIDSADGVSLFLFTLNYDNTKLRVIAVDNMQLLTSGGGTVLNDSSDTMPDTDGALNIAFTDRGLNHESGDGVLSRITLEGIGTGVSNLTLATEGPFAIQIGWGFVPFVPFPINSVFNASVALGEPCPVTPPTLTATPMATPTSIATPSPTPPATPTPTSVPTTPPSPTTTPPSAAAPGAPAAPDSVGGPAALPDAGRGSPNRHSEGPLLLVAAVAIAVAGLAVVRLGAKRGL